MRGHHGDGAATDARNLRRSRCPARYAKGSVSGPWRRPRNADGHCCGGVSCRASDIKMFIMKRRPPSATARALHGLPQATKAGPVLAATTIPCDHGSLMIVAVRERKYAWKAACTGAELKSSGTSNAPGASRG